MILLKLGDRDCKGLTIGRTY